MRAFLPVCLLMMTPALARASELPPPPPEAMPAPPNNGTTVIAPPGSSGVTVVAPTAQGGTVTAQGCQSVTVSGAPIVVEPGAPCPYQPPPPRIIYIERDPAPKFRKDTGRSAAIALSAVAQGVGSLVTLGVYLEATNDYQCSYASNSFGPHCTRSNAIGELLLYGGLMTLAPAIPRMVVGDATGAAWFSAGIVASIALGKAIDASDEGFNQPGTGFAMFGFIGAAAIGIIELATTPHREDLEQKQTGPSIDGFTAAPLADTRGSHGMSFGVLGSF
ncbi:MAG: hypothetical protein ACXWP4_28510 [Polyangiales bacterium]